MGKWFVGNRFSNVIGTTCLPFLCLTLSASPVLSQISFRFVSFHFRKELIVLPFYFSPVFGNKWFLLASKDF